MSEPTPEQLHIQKMGAVADSVLDALVMVATVDPMPLEVMVERLVATPMLHPGDDREHYLALMLATAINRLAR